MGIFDFFKKKENSGEELVEVSFENLEEVLEEKSNEIKDKEKEIFSLIEERTTNFSKKLDEGVGVLERIEVEAKKEHGRAKLIVRQGLDGYINCVKVFEKSLRELEKENLGDFFKGLGKTFSDFKKNSSIFYERATYLIGKEIAFVKEIIREQSLFFEKLYLENKSLILRCEKINSIMSLIREVGGVGRNIEKMNEEVRGIGEEILGCGEKIEELVKEIEVTKESKTYKESKDKRVQIGEMERNLSENVLKIKGLIDFKKLANIYHSNPKDMEKVKDYRDNFFDKVNGGSVSELLKLLKEANFGWGTVDKINEYIDKKEQLFRKRAELKTDKIEEFLEEKKKIEFKVREFMMEKEKHLKRLEKVIESRNVLINLIKEKSKLIGLSI